jgi:hypothetical protein
MSNITKQLEEIRLEKSKQYNKKIEQEERQIQLNNEKQHKHNLEELEIKNHQLQLEKEKTKNDIPMIHEEYLDESILMIVSMFEDNNEINISEFVKNKIVYNFYYKMMDTDIDNSYSFYIFIQEISTTYDEISYELIVNCLSMINMDFSFLNTLVKLNKLEYIKMIFLEFIKLMNNIKFI